jgi:hypothetical protein
MSRKIALETKNENEIAHWSPEKQRWIPEEPTAPLRRDWARRVIECLKTPNGPSLGGQAARCKVCGIKLTPWGRCEYCGRRQYDERRYEEP